jgi:L-lactate dehydrogenase
MSIIEKLMGMRIKEEEKVTCKVSIVGVGELGSAIAYTILLKGFCNELALMDTDENLLNGELLDLKQGLAYQTNMNIMGSTDPSITANSKIVILALGARPQPGHSVYSPLDKNVEIYKG